MEIRHPVNIAKQKICDQAIWVKNYNFRYFSRATMKFLGPWIKEQQLQRVTLENSIIKVRMHSNYYFARKPARATHSTLCIDEVFFVNTC